MATTGLEVEAKFFLPDLAAVREQLLALGAGLERPRVYERNIRLEIEGDGLLGRGQLLRLRQDGRNVVTFKGAPPAGTQSEVKVHEELEVTVSDFDTILAIFQRLGYEPVQIYEKYRETFSLAGLEIVLDELPYGNFIELEGDEAAIKIVAEQLGLPWAERINSNYLALMGRLIAHHQLPFQDITFSNFAGTDYTIADILDELIRS